MYNGIETPITEKIGEKIINHRNRFYRLFSNRYYEFLPLTIGLEGAENTQIDQIKLEHMLRSGLGACVGALNNGAIALLGYVNRNVINSHSSFLYTNHVYNKKDINFIIPKNLLLDEYNEITDYNLNGNFVVIWNKPYNLVNDFEIIEHYANEVTEIVVSRYSIIMQSKINTFLRDEYESDDISQMASDLYNGIPYITTSMLFDPEEHIISISNNNFISSLAELKRTYQNTMAELNAMLGLNSLGVDKESGVSDTEAQSNRSFKKANENIYLKARNEALNRLNKVFKTEIRAEYTDSMVKELSSLEKFEVLEKGD